ncbi:MFS transporter [Methylorubrum rhodesianum]|uniref:MFS transporter n=1 Tax=Methylorubrum rhodesianum TaxID=29427 RepID=UPI003D041F14
MSFSAADRLERLPITNYHRFLFIVISLAFFFDNFELATMTFVLGSIKQDLGLTTAQAGLLGSVSFVGMALGAISSGALADRFGRRPIFQFSMIIWGGASLLCASAHDAPTLALYRFFLGLGMGMELPLAATMLAEFIPTKQRGRYLALMDGNWPLAFISAGMVSYYVLPISDWRTMFIIGAVPSVFLFVIRRYIPESPRWLEAKGRQDEADAVVADIERKVMKSGKLTSLPSVVTTIGSAQSSTGGIRVLWSADYRRRTAVVGGLWFFALLGFYGLNTWISAIVQQSGVGVAKSVLFTVWISLGGIPGFLWAAWAVDAWGRKATCVITLVGGAVMAFVFGNVLGMTTSAYMAIAAGLMMQFFLFGMWAVLYTYTPELYPSRARASGCGFASFCGRIGALIGPTAVGLILPIFAQAGVFAFGAACFVAAALVVLIGGVETRAQKLEEISD